MVAFGITTVLIIDIATMVVTTSCMLLVWRTTKTARPKVKNTFWADFREGLAFLRHTPGITVLMLLITLVTFCMGFLQTLKAMKPQTVQIVRNRFTWCFSTLENRSL